VVLVKASRAAGLESVALALTGERALPGERPLTGEHPLTDELTRSGQ
jgi:hypothetical protein